MGKLAGAKGCTAFGVERNGRLGQAGNGYAIRAFGNRTSAKPRGYFGQIERFWAQNGHNPKQATKRKPPKRLFRRFKFGSPSWARTSDLRINSPSLYRLSYQGMET